MMHPSIYRSSSAHARQCSWNIRRAAVVLLIGACSLFPSSALASAFLMPTNVITVPVGSTVSVPIGIDPSGETHYTVRFGVTYPSALQLASFEFARGWIPVSQPGYDVVDNAQGLVLKTAGYPGGFSTVQPFGVAVFRATRAGEAIITVEPRAFILDADSNSTLRSRPRIRVIVTEKATRAPSRRATSTTPVAPLPDLLAEKQNLFDITAEPRYVDERPSLFLFAGAFLLGIVIAVVTTRVVTTWGGRKRRSPRASKL